MEKETDMFHHSGNQINFEVKRNRWGLDSMLQVHGIHWTVVFGLKLMGIIGSYKNNSNSKEAGTLYLFIRKTLKL